MIEPKYADTDVNGDDLSATERQWIRDETNRFFPEEYVKRNWKTGPGRDQWCDVLERAKRGTSLAEWLSVADDRSDRQAISVELNEQTVPNWMERISEYDLHFYQIDDQSRGIVAANTDVADAVLEAETELEGEDRDEVLGDLYGYPDCCREFYVDRVRQDDRRDPLYEIACNSDSVSPIDGDRERLLAEGVEPWANVLYRQFGWTFISHLPCSFDCERSFDVGETRGEIMADHGFRDAANHLWEWLQLPMTWTAFKALSHVRNRYFIGSASTSCYWSEKEIVWKRPHQAGGQIVDE
ncbi:hypothetical protein [Halovivax cerinus]|uniref:Uncharacterized protein n=1 Tax=Halovivax cerinus TaxID=1487865 RepID=A0ABD5NK85_9EURY|nr:hypothetical protein [Halovivax cerinus]